MMITVEQLRQALESAPSFIPTTWVDQLQERARQVSDLSFLGLGGGLAQEKILNGDNLRSEGAVNLINTLVEATTAQSLAKLSGDDDPYDFRSCVNLSVSEATMIDALTRLMGYCYADHLESHLASKGLPKLSTLQRDATFVKEYQKMFLDSNTIVEQVERDLMVGNIAYSASLLFVANYFAHEATPLLHEPSKIWVEEFGKIAQAKIQATSGHAELIQADNFAALVRLISQSMTIAYGQQVDSGQGLLRPPHPGEILQPLAGMDVSDDVKKQIEQLISQNTPLGDWKAYGEVMVSHWDDKASKYYNDAVRSQAKIETAHYEYGGFTISPVGSPLPPVITTTTGQSVKDWISRARSSHPSMVVKDPPTNWKISTASPFGSCFVAGTEVITRSGVKKIENLAEHDWVLTRGEFDEWGAVSDEKVVVPVEMPIIHGFNHEDPFFTAGHVFFTTTGLRALDPTLAMKENPWADVGRLAVGNVVLRLDTNMKKYEQVIITSISSERMQEVKHVYGVHLREGRRSYHANRYLVSVNYPEITMKSICKMLRTVPVEEQARMLLAFEELRPLFQRFGIGGISDILKSEVEAESDKNSMRLYKTTRNKLTGPGNGSLQFPPEEIPGVDYSNLLTPLPTVSVLEGVVFVDGEACQRASISNMNNEIRWSRQVGQNVGATEIFEHGRLVVDPLTHSAQGDILYSRDAAASDVIPVGFIHFLAIGCNFESPPSYEQALAAPAYSMAATALATVAFTQEASIFKGDGMNLKSAVAGSDQAPAIRAARSEPVAMVATASADPDDTEADPLFVPEEETLPLMNPLRFNMIYDANRWKKDQVSPGDPLTFGPLDLAVGRKHAAGLATRVALLPDLDKLHDIITNKHVDASLGRLASFYVSTLSVDQEGRTKISITLLPNAQELLRSYRDKSTGDENYSLMWTFKDSLGTDISLGMMFSSMELTLGPDGKTAMGTISEYSSDSDTGEGQKHLFLSNPADTARRVDIEKRLDGSNTAGGVATGSPTTPISTPQLPPASRLGPKGPYHVSTIEAIPYNNEDLEKKSKQVLEDIMFYHMTTEDLNDIFNKKKPDNLPDHLAQGLPSNLRDWIRDTYSPAYTALTIAESYNTKDWQSKFTKEERSKILYFWQGDGPNCLSNSTQYKTLNQLAVRESMLRLYSVLDQFVTDSGVDWATKYYNEVKAIKLYDAAEQVVATNQQPLQKYCNILYVLDPDGQYAKTFYDDVVALVASQVVLQRAELSGELSPPWLPDACDRLTDALLNPNDKSIRDDVRKAFMKDFEQFCKDQNIEFDRENKAKAAAQLAGQLKLAASIPKAFGAAAIFSKGLWYRSGTIVKQNAWLKSNDISKTGGKLATTIKVLALFANVAGIIFNKDVTLSDSEKAKMGGTIAKNVMDILGPHFIKTGPRNLAQIQAETAILNDKARKTPFGWRRGKLVEEKVKYMEKLGEEALQQERKIARSGGLLSRIKSKLSMPPRIVRILTIALAVAYIGFLIWDLAVHGGAMSAGQLALGIINIILEAAVVIVEVLSLIFPAVSIIPVIGQVLAIALLVVGVLIMIFGSTEHQKTPGEKFVERMQAKDGFLSKLDKPPGSLLTASITPESGNKGSSWSFTVTLSNDTAKTIKFIDDAPSLSGIDPSTDTINSTSLSFFGGSDESTLFSNAAFSRPGEPVQTGTGTWQVTTPGGSGGASNAWDVVLQKPSGTNLQSTNFELRVKGVAEQTASIAPKEKIVFTVTGTLGAKEGTAMIKVVEKRPGAPFCPSPFQITRN